MFERFTERARQIIVKAQEVSRENKHELIDIEHLFCGIVAEQEGLAARVLASMDFTVESTTDWLLVRHPQGDKVINGQIPFTPETKKALECSLREALSLGHNYIGTEHVLLGLIRTEQGAKCLGDHTPEDVRNKVIEILSGQPRGQRVTTEPKPAEEAPDPEELQRKLDILRRTAKELSLEVEISAMRKEIEGIKRTVTMIHEHLTMDPPVDDPGPEPGEEGHGIREPLDLAKLARLGADLLDVFSEKRK